MLPTDPTSTVACSVTVPIVAHQPIAESMWRLRLDCPTLAAAARPGQFAMVRIPHRHDPLLARPLAVYDTFGSLAEPTSWQRQTAGAAGGPLRYADFVYSVAGKFTTAATALRPGDELTLWGPLGNGFSLPPATQLVLVAGGIGQTALLMLGRAWLAANPGCRATFCWGGRDGRVFGHVEDFEQAGLAVNLATLDGSAGTRGTVVDLLDTLETRDGFAAGTKTAIACCGPEGMLAAVAGWAAERGIGCQVSLETPMACGVGICFSCVAPIRDAAGGWDYRRTCIEGPVFEAAAVAWDALD